jgi:hypothetical protein
MNPTQAKKQSKNCNWQPANQINSLSHEIQNLLFYFAFSSAVLLPE